MVESQEQQQQTFDPIMENPGKILQSISNQAMNTSLESYAM